MQGTSKGDLPLKSLPLKARLAHKMNVSQPLLSLGQLANEGWYIGPALNKYRNYTIFLPGTRGTRDSNRVDFFPTKCRLPDSESADRLSVAL